MPALNRATSYSFLGLAAWFTRVQVRLVRARVRGSSGPIDHCDLIIMSWL